MKQDERTPFDRALKVARETAYAPGEYVEQENFMLASEIRVVGQAAGIGQGTNVLDLCCGVAGPGRFLTREFGCRYRGVDLSETAISIARSRATGLDCTFEVAAVPPLPNGQFDVIVLLETMLAFPDKRPLVQAISESLADGGRFAFTVEEGAPMTVGEEDLMPDADTVWLTPLADMLALLEEAGLSVIWQEEQTDTHRAMADALADAFEADADAITRQLDQQALDDLVTAHRQWSRWMASGRVRKFAIVAQKPAR